MPNLILRAKERDDVIAYILSLLVVGLRERPAVVARALEFGILTPARSGETLAARWDEIDFAGKIWTGSRLLNYIIRSS
jgi:hypothetical protein